MDWILFCWYVCRRAKTETWSYIGIQMSINSYIYHHHRAIIVIIIIITIVIIFQRFNSDYVTSLHVLRDSHFTYHIQGIIIIIIITIIIIFQCFNSDYVTSLHALRDSHFTYHIQGSIGQVFSHSLNSLDCLKSNWTDGGNCPAFLYCRCTDHKLLLFYPRSSAVPPYSAHVDIFVRPHYRLEAGTWESLKKKMTLIFLHIQCKSYVSETLLESPLRAKALQANALHINVHYCHQILWLYVCAWSPGAHQMLIITNNTNSSLFIVEVHLALN